MQKIPFPLFVTSLFLMLMGSQPTLGFRMTVIS
jgi:hypothetical protein